VRVQGSSDSPGRNREEDQVSFGLSPRLRTHLDLPFIVVPSARSAPEYMRFFPLQQLKLPRVLSLVPRSCRHEAEDDLEPVGQGGGYGVSFPDARRSQLALERADELSELVVGHGQVGLRDSYCPGVGLLDDVGEGGRHLGRECEVDVEEAREQFPQRRPIGSDFARGRCGV
jgi:hypothetical protein